MSEPMRCPQCRTLLVSFVPMRDPISGRDELRPDRCVCGKWVQLTELPSGMLRADHGGVYHFFPDE